MVIFLNTFHPSPVLLSLGPVTIYWYGVFAILGILAAWITVKKVSLWNSIKGDLTNLFFGIAVSALIGARAYHVLNEYTFYLNNPSYILKVWEGGLAFHGGLFGGALFVLWWGKLHNISFWRLADVIAPALALFQGIARWGNYFNQELFGKPTSLPWGIPIEGIKRPLEFQNATYFHPTFLYESIFDIAIFGILIQLHRLRVRGRINTREGNIFLLYLLLYSAVRFTLEFIRIDDTPVIFGFRLPQIVSALIFTASLFIIFNKRLNKSRI